MIDHMHIPEAKVTEVLRVILQTGFDIRQAIRASQSEESKPEIDVKSLSACSLMAIENKKWEILCCFWGAEFVNVWNSRDLQLVVESLLETN